MKEEIGTHPCLTPRGRIPIFRQLQTAGLMSTSAPAPDILARAALVLADGTTFEGFGFGGDALGVGEVCFNTAMTGYQEILTDPSYAGQIVCFTFPHIGIVGTNLEDIESLSP